MRGKTPTVPTVVLVGEYLAGDTLREIAARYGVSFQTLAVQLRNAGIERRPRGLGKHEARICANPACQKVFKPKDAAQRYCCNAHVERKGKHRQTHCKRGHPLMDGNLDPRSRGTPPRCSTCRRMKQAEYKKRKRAA